MNKIKKILIKIYGETIFFRNIFVETYKKALSEKKSFLSLSNYLFFERIYNNILKKDDYLVVDVGTNDGWFVKAILHFNSEINIISYEPLKSAVEALKILNKYKNFSFKNIALGKSIGQLELNEYSTTGLSSLLSLNDGEYNKVGFDTKIKEKYIVDVATLDNELKDEKRKIFLKVDVQGFEMEVLKGAINLFKNNKIEAVLIELVNKEKYSGQALSFEIIDFLGKYNFIIFDLHPFYYENNSGQLTEFDALFVKNKVNLI